MIDSGTVMQAKAFARIDGLWLALVWTCSMLLLMYMPESMWGGMMALSTPFFVGWRTGLFRDRVLEGLISFRRAFFYACYTFFYAVLLFAVVQFVYFTYLDGGRFMQIINTTVQMITPYYKQQGISIEEIKLAQEMLATSTPASLTFFFMTYNLLASFLMSPIIALFCRRKEKK